MSSRLILLFCLAFLCAGLAADRAVQAGPAAKPPAVQPARPPMPDAAKIRILIVNSLVALNQANLTGNYTVLRDLGSSIFRATNTDAHLAELFSELRKRNLDLAPIVMFEPKLSHPPEISEQGVLRLGGVFETAPEQVAFDIAYIPEQGDWRLLGLRVATQPAPGQDTPAADPPAANN